VQSLTVLIASLLVAFFIDRDVKERRPEEWRPLMIAVSAAMAAPVAIILIATFARDSAVGAVHFAAFAAGVTLMGYMFAAGSWALRFLAAMTARYR
jgi:hypothetical protein